MGIGGEWHREANRRREGCEAGSSCSPWFRQEGVFSFSAPRPPLAEQPWRLPFCLIRKNKISSHSCVLPFRSRHCRAGALCTHEIHGKTGLAHGSATLKENSDVCVGLLIKLPHGLCLPVQPVSCSSSGTQKVKPKHDQARAQTNIKLSSEWVTIKNLCGLNKECFTKSGAFYETNRPRISMITDYC